MRLVALFFAGLLWLALPAQGQGATYLEIYDIARGESATEAADLRRRVAVACMIKAQTILDEAAPSQTRLDWAKQALEDPLGAAVPLFSYALAAAAAASQQAILDADDTTVQASVDAAVDALYP